MKKVKFKNLKEEILIKAKEANACTDQYQRAADATNEEELLKVISDNLGWCVGRKIVSHEYFAQFTPEIYLASGIANVGADNIGYRNTGDSNTGYSNTGDRNTGDRNTGYRNTGDRNTGDRNTGDRNTGDSNTGSWNTGDRNTGDRNTGSWNTGDRNTGSWNTGSWNTGYRNTGYSNTGDRNTGVFCTGEKTMKFFDKESDWTERQFLDSKAYQLLCDVDTKMWVPESIMTDEEKTLHRGWKTAGGFYRDIPFKEAFAAKWHNWSDDNKKAFTSLPNFDAAIFEQITSVKV